MSKTTAAPAERAPASGTSMIPSFGYSRCSDPKQEKSIGEQKPDVE